MVEERRTAGRGKREKVKGAKREKGVLRPFAEEGKKVSASLRLRI